MNRVERERPAKIKIAKEWIFQYIFEIQSNRISNVYISILLLLLQITIPLYFYFHKNLSVLSHLSIYQRYLSSVNIYLIHINSFNSITLILISLSIYPAVAIIGLIIKKIGKNKVLVVIFQILLALYDLWFLKIIIQIINGFSYSQFVPLILFLGGISLLFGSVKLFLDNNMHKYLQIILVILLENNANEYLIISCLAIRLLILTYIFYPKNKNILRHLIQISLFIILMCSYYIGNNFVDYLALLLIFISHLIYGLNQFYKNYNGETDLITLVQELEEESQEQQAFKQKIINNIFQILQKHEIDCLYTQCMCHQYRQIKLQSIKQWIFKFQEQRFRRKTQISDRIAYAMKCADKYQYKLTGLLKVCSQKSQNYFEQYKIYKVCLMYELNLRKNDKNYKYGQKYYDVHQQIQNFKSNIENILAMIKQFWHLVVDFDGTLKFLNSILQISTAIKEFDHNYDDLVFKYDEDSSQFQYLFKIFQTIILNEKNQQDDELVVPNQSIFFITNQFNIINANNNFASLVKQPMDSIIGKKYTSYIPEVYREVHEEWAQKLLQNINQDEHKQYLKCFSLGNIQITMVNMSHKILPRFIDGIEIFTNISISDHCNKIKKSFIFLVQKQTFFIKNVQDTFFQIIKFKVSHKNIKILQESSLNSIFKNFTLMSSENPTRQVAMHDHFITQMTYGREKKIQNKLRSQKRIMQQKRSSKNDVQSKKSNFSAAKKRQKVEQEEQIFQYQIIPNTKSEDPYLKILFKLKQQKKYIQQQTQSNKSEQNLKKDEQVKQNKNQGSENKINFYIAYYIVLIYLGFHLLFRFSMQDFYKSFNDLKNRQTFLINYDLTILYTEQNPLGIDKSLQLKNTWIYGFGDYSESFNSIRKIEDPYFETFFKKQSPNYHNAFRENIQKNMYKSEDDLKTFTLWLFLFVLLGLIHYFVDFILSLRYIFYIEERVGILLLQFAVIQISDIMDIIKVITNFQVNILNSAEAITKKTFKVPAELVYEESALELNKNDRLSLNNSAQIQNQSQVIIENPGNFRYKKRRASRLQNKERVSLSLMKKQFKMHDNILSSANESAIHNQEDESIRYENIIQFKQKHNGFLFIFSANKLLLSFVLLSFSLSIIMFVIMFFTIYQPITYLPNHLKILNTFHQSKIILLKTIAEIETKQKLNPQITLSKNLLDSIILLNQLPNSKRIESFNSLFEKIRRQNVCFYLKNFNCSLIANINEINNYGIRIINQYLQEYLRTANETSLKTQSNYNNAIRYDLELYAYLSTNFEAMTIEHFKDLQNLQLNLIIISALLSLFGSVILHIALKQFKNRIENTLNLLRIIPENIKQKSSEVLKKILNKNEIKQ